MIATKAWWSAAGRRALKTFCQVAVTLIGTNLLITDIDWLTVGSASVISAVLSLLTSLAGLPEVSKD